MSGVLPVLEGELASSSHWSHGRIRVWRTMAGALEAPHTLPAPPILTTADLLYPLVSCLVMQTAHKTLDPYFGWGPGNPPHPPSS